MKYTPTRYPNIKNNLVLFFMKLTLIGTNFIKKKTEIINLKLKFDLIYRNTRCEARHDIYIVYILGTFL